MTNDELLFRHRLRLFARARDVGVSQACRELGYQHSSYYRWRPFVDRHAMEILRPRERRPPRMPNQLAPFMEERIVAFALGHSDSARGASPPSCIARPWGGTVV